MAPSGRKKAEKQARRARKAKKRAAKPVIGGRSLLISDPLPLSFYSTLMPTVSQVTSMPVDAEPQSDVVLEQSDSYTTLSLSEDLRDVGVEADAVLAELHSRLVTSTRAEVASGPLDEDLIAKIQQTSEADLCRVLGDYMGCQIKRFCDAVDFGHPALSSEIAHGFMPDSEFVATLRELLTFLDRSADLVRVATLLKGTLAKEKTFQDIRNIIYKPPTRCLKSPTARTAVRKKKTVKVLATKDWFTNNQQKGWSGLNPAFRLYSRLSNSHETEAEANKKRQSLLGDLGAKNLAALVGRRNELIADVVSERYCGFSKMKLLDAAIMLAKLHGAQYRADYNTLSYPRKMFSSTKFWLEPGSQPDRQFWGRDCSPNADPTLEHGVGVDSYIPPESFVVTPRAYPIHAFPTKQPAAVQGVLAAVEAHPDAGHRPLFDQYWVVVPGVTVTEESFCFENWWVLRKGDDDTNIEFYREQSDIEKAIDFYLVERGGVVPALLGEKDGRCYFLTMWR